MRALVLILILGLVSCSTHRNNAKATKVNIIAEPRERSVSFTHEHLHRIDRMGNPEIGPWFVCFTPKSIGPLNLPRGNKRMRMPCTDKFIENTLDKHGARITGSDNLQGSVLDMYNQEDAFNVSPVHSLVYRDLFREALMAWDEADSLENIHTSDKPPLALLDWWHWNHNGLEHPLLQRMVKADFLLLDTNRKCAVDSRKSRGHMDIEMTTLLSGKPYNKTCGGRTVTDDVLDTLLTVYMNGPRRLPSHWWRQHHKGNGPERGDGLREPSDPVPNEFPWVNID